MHPSGHASLQNRGDQTDEAEELAGLLGAVGEEVVGHEGEGELHAREEEDEGKVGHVQQQVGVGSRVLLERGIVLGGFRAAAIRLGLVSVMGFRQGIVEVDGLSDNEGKRDAGSGCKGVRGDTVDPGQPRAQGGAESESDREASAHQSHGLASVLVGRDIGGYGKRKLDITFTQSSHDPTGQKSAKVGGSTPEGDGGNIAAHGAEQGGTSAIFVGQGANYGRDNGLAEGEERAQGASEQDNVVAVVDGPFEAVFVGVQAVEHLGQHSGIGLGLDIAVELKQLGEQGQDEGEGNLKGRRDSRRVSRLRYGHRLKEGALRTTADMEPAGSFLTRSKIKEMISTLSTFLRC